MAVHIFTKDSNLDENSINDSFVMYLNKFIEGATKELTYPTDNNCALMSYDEFKEYYILKVLGRSSEFTDNIARDFQYLAFDNFQHVTP